MRLIRTKLRKNARQLLADLAKDTALEANYLIDMFALFNNGGTGIPTEDRLRKIIKFQARKTGVGEANVGIFARKRRQQLKALVADPFFHAYSHQKNKIEGLRLYVLSALEVAAKKQEVQCLTCKLHPQCKFGQEYGKHFRDPKMVLDQDYLAKVHPDCPDFPEIDQVNKVASAGLLFAQMYSPAGEEDRAVQKQLPSGSLSAQAANKSTEKKMVEAAEEVTDLDLEEDDEDESLDIQEAQPFYAGPGQFSKGAGLRRLFTNTNPRDFESLVKTMTKETFLLWELGRKFSVALAGHKKGKDKATPKIAQNKEDTKMRTLSDLPKIAPGQHGLPQEIFEAKLERKELLRVQHRQPEDKRQQLYVLIDSSGSMTNWLTPSGLQGRRSLFNRSALSCVFALALSRKIELEKGYMFVRFFGSSSSRCFIGKDAASYKALRKLIALNSYNGGGTNILSAVLVALNDIRAAALPDVETAELLVITDCQDGFSEDDLKQTVKANEFNILDVSGGPVQGNAVSMSLRNCANKYFKADETVDISKMVQLL